MPNQKRRWLEERKRDYYHKKALEMGYRSRAIFKLAQIDQKFAILRIGDYVLDLGCSPGGWSQYAIEKVGASGVVFGVDIEPIMPLRSKNFRFVRLDLMEEGSVQKLKQEIGTRVDLVISDLAPDMSGTYGVDSSRQSALAQRALDVGIGMLRSGGNLVVKVFEGSESGSIERKAKELFNKVTRMRPLASRKHSSEFYLICLDFRPRRALACR